MEKLKELIEKIKWTANLIIEQQSSKAFKNDVILVCSESIILLCEKAIGEVEESPKGV